MESTSIVNNKTAYVASEVKGQKDPYLGMEVLFRGKNKLKGYKGRVIGSQLNEPVTVPKAIIVDKTAGAMVKPSEHRITVTVQMLTQAVNTIVQEKIVNLIDTKYYSPILPIVTCLSFLLELVFLSHLHAGYPKLVCPFGPS